MALGFGAQDAMKALEEENQALKKELAACQEKYENERHWRIYHEGAAVAAQAELAILRGRPRPRGYLG